MPTDKPNFQAQKRPLGKTGLECSILGMGGFHLGTVASQAEVNNMVAKAIDHGINIFDNAWEYHRGLSEEKLGIALNGKRDKVIVMSAVCTHGRNQDVAMRMLDASLIRLQTDHLDVWQIHEVIYHNDPELIYASDGVLEALTKAKQQGKVRFVGFDGHKHPAIHLEMLNRGYAFDVVQMPLNPLDPAFRSFETNVLPVANRRGIAVLGMKSMGGSGETHLEGCIHSLRSTFLCHEPPRCHDHQRHRFHGSPRPESGDPARFQAAHRRPDAGAPRPRQTIQRRSIRTLQKHTQIRQQPRPQPTRLSLNRRTSCLSGDDCRPADTSLPNTYLAPSVRRHR